MNTTSKAGELRRRARKTKHVRYFDEFELGQTFDHHWGRTLSEADNALFCSLTMHYTPLYLNDVYARAHGHDSVLINPYLAFLTVFGMSVEDLSEAGGAFLGVDDLTFHKDVFPGDTLTAASTVVNLRESDSRPRSGIATWHTVGRNQNGDVVIDYRRTNMIAKRGTQ
jgi:itaconyl-CoA hydratase